MLTIAIGGDHGGFAMKRGLIEYLERRGYAVTDCGSYSAEPCDYPLIAARVAGAVASGQRRRGILLCKSGIGMAIAANKVPGIRAAVCGDAISARKSREHNDANVLVLGAERLSLARARRLTALWLRIPFERGRHARRVRQITQLERRYSRRTVSRRPRRRAGREAVA